MFVKIIIFWLFGLGLTTVATAAYVSIAAKTDVQAAIIGPVDTRSNSDDMADFMAAVAEVPVDNRDDQHYTDHDSVYQRHIGLGFSRSTSIGNPLNGECNGNGHLGNADGDGYHNRARGYNNCGEQSPSD